MEMQGDLELSSSCGHSKSIALHAIISSEEDVGAGQTQPVQQGTALRWVEEAETWSQEKKRKATPKKRFLWVGGVSKISRGARDLSSTSGTLTVRSYTREMNPKTSGFENQQDT